LKQKSAVGSLRTRRKQSTSSANLLTDCYFRRTIREFGFKDVDLTKRSGANSMQASKYDCPDTSGQSSVDEILPRRSRASRSAVSALGVLAATLVADISIASPVTLDAIAVSAQPAPGTGDVFGGFSQRAHIDDSGVVAFTGYLINPTDPAPSYVYDRGELRLIKQTRGGIHSFRGVGGDVFFGGHMTASDPLNSIFVYDGTTFSRLFTYGQYIPELDANAVGPFYIQRPIVGQAMTATISLSGPNVADSNDLAIVRADGHEVTVISREGDESPIPGAYFSSEPYRFPGWHDTSENGKVILIGNLTGAGVDETNDQGLFQYVDGKLETVLRTGESDPDSGLIFYDLMRAFIDEQGTTILLAGTTGTSGAGSNDALLV
jgi:hypothetical protein